jgi:hypothetical protein
LASRNANLSTRARHESSTVALFLAISRDPVQRLRHAAPLDTWSWQYQTTFFSQKMRGSISRKAPHQKRPHQTPDSHELGVTWLATYCSHLRLRVPSRASRAATCQHRRPANLASPPRWITFPQLYPNGGGPGPWSPTPVPEPGALAHGQTRRLRCFAEPVLSSKPAQ